MERIDAKRLRHWRAIAKQGPTEIGYRYFRRRRRRRNIGDEDALSEGDQLALSGAFDIHPGELERNAELLRAYESLPELDVGSIQWFVPWFHHPYFAGVYTILRFADHFAREHGVRSRFCIYDSPAADSHVAVARKIGEAFPALAGSDVSQWRRNASGDPFAHLPPADVAMATFWTSAYHVMRYNRCRAKFFFVQDFEPAFYPAGSGWALAEETWHFGFPGIVNTPGLADVYRSYGNAAVSFVPAVDTARYHPPARRPSEDGGPLRVFFYGRPGQPRNAFGLGLATLAKVKERFGDRVEIVSAGADWHPGAYGVRGRIENLGMLPDLDAVADVYRSCDVGLVFMLTKHPSYQPLEFMASGMVTVTNANPATEWLLRHDENALVAPPAVSLVAEQITRALEDPELRARLSAKALAEVRETRWDEQLERVWGTITTRGERFVGGETELAPARRTGA